MDRGGAGAAGPPSGLGIALMPGGDEPHRRSESKAPKIIPIVIQVVDCKRNVDLAGLEERVQRLTVIQANGAIPAA